MSNANAVKNKVVFETIDENGSKAELAVRRPTIQEEMQAKIEYSKAVRKYIEAKMMLRENLETHLRAQGLWSDEKQKQRELYEKNILDGTRKLKKGGIKLADAKDVAIDIKRNRLALRELISDYLSLDNITVQGQAENDRFNFLVSVCTIYNNTGEPYFSSLENYLNRSTEQAAADAAEKLANMMFGLDNDSEDKLPENQFLRKYKFVDEKGRLINKDGKLCDLDGRLLNEDGRYVDKDGNFIDVDGNPVDENGEILEDFTPFLDDDGEQISEESEIGV